MPTGMAALRGKEKVQKTMRFAGACRVFRRGVDTLTLISLAGKHVS
jgi:hypothetical protein